MVCRWEKRADFVDDKFLPAEIVGFVVIGDGLSEGNGWVDSFQFTATDDSQGLVVSPKTKLATIWGELKQK